MVSSPADRAMERAEKRKKFHEALLRIYHPPSPPKPATQSSPQRTIQEDDPDLGFDFDPGTCPTSDVVDEEQKGRSPSEQSDTAPQKLTRAQRKRMRKRKLKEAAASVRRQIVGPLLPSGYEDAQREGDC